MCISFSASGLTTVMQLAVHKFCHRAGVDLYATVLVIIREDHLIFRNDVSNPKRIISSPFVPLHEYRDSSTSHAHDKPSTVQQMTNSATYSQNLSFLWHSYVHHHNVSRENRPQLRQLGPVHVHITYILNPYFNIILPSVTLYFLSNLPLVVFSLNCKCILQTIPFILTS